MFVLTAFVSLLALVSATPKPNIEARDDDTSVTTSGYGGGYGGSYCPPGRYWGGVCHPCTKDKWYPSSGYEKPTCHTCVQAKWWDNRCHDCTNEFWYSVDYKPPTCQPCKKGQVLSAGKHCCDVKTPFWHGGACQACKQELYYPDNGYGPSTCHKCKQGYFWDEKWKQCCKTRKCPPYAPYFHNGDCRQCKEELFYPDNSYGPSTCHKCQKGYFWDEKWKQCCKVKKPKYPY